MNSATHVVRVIVLLGSIPLYGASLHGASRVSHLLLPDSRNSSEMSILSDSPDLEKAASTHTQSPNGRTLISQGKHEVAHISNPQSQKKPPGFALSPSVTGSKSASHVLTSHEGGDSLTSSAPGSSTSVPTPESVAHQKHSSLTNSAQGSSTSIPATESGAHEKITFTKMKHSVSSLGKRHPSFLHQSATKFGAKRMSMQETFVAVCTVLAVIIMVSLTGNYIVKYTSGTLNFGATVPDRFR